MGVQDIDTGGSLEDLGNLVGARKHFLTCTTALLPTISRTCPFLICPSPRTTLTISAYLEYCKAKRNERLT